MKKVFVVVMDYEENTESLFTEVGIGCTLDDDLYELKERGHIKSYEYTDAYEVKDEQQEEFISLLEKYAKS